MTGILIPQQHNVAACAVLLLQEFGHPGVFSACSEQGPGGKLAGESVQSVQIWAAVHASGCVWHQA